MKELIIVVLKAIAGLPADILNFFRETSTSMFFGAMASQTETMPMKASICFIFLNIWLLYFISEQKIGTKRMSEIMIEIGKEKDESKKRNLMEEYSLNEHTCRKEKLIRRYKRLFLITVCLICVVAGIGVAFFEIVGGLVLRSEVYAEFGTLAVIAMLAGLFLWAVSMESMGFFDDTEEAKKEESQKQEVAE